MCKVYSSVQPPHMSAACSSAVGNIVLGASDVKEKHRGGQLEGQICQQQPCIHAVGQH